MPERKGKDAFYCSGCKKTLPKGRFKKNPRKRWYVDGTPTYSTWCKRCLKLTQKYGMTCYQYDIMLIEQRGKCLVCEEPATCIDHNHNTGQVRGLLCQKCNIGLGYFNESPALLRKAALYIIATSVK